MRDVIFHCNTPRGAGGPAVARPGRLRREGGPDFREFYARLVPFIGRIPAVALSSQETARFNTIGFYAHFLYEVEKPYRARVKSTSSKWAVESVSASSRRRIRQ